jgi:hypothetical protein
MFRLFRSDVVDEPGEPLRLRGYTELNASNDTLRGFLDRMGSISFPIAPPADETTGLDGTTYYLALCGDWSESRFRWWESPPPNWESLGLIAHEMIATFLNLTPAAA